MGRRFWAALLALLMVVIGPAGARAGLVNDVPSCYVATNIAAPDSAYDVLLYVLIDETMHLDPQLTQSALENVSTLLNPGTKFVVAQFSAFSQGRYLTVLHTGIVEKPLDLARVDDTPIRTAQGLEACLAMQRRFAARMALGDMATSFEASTESLAKSDIMDALRAISGPIAQDPASHKIVFVITDGLENSSITSFYAHRTVRLIDPSRELAKAKAADMMGNFGGARVFVLGGAMAPTSTGRDPVARLGYRDPRILHALAEFWSQYFAQSNASLVAFGEPALLSPITVIRTGVNK